MPPRRGYTDNDIQRMQQDAIARAKEMQSRAHHKTAETDTTAPPAPPMNNHQGWSTNPGVVRRRNNYRYTTPSGQKPEPVTEAENIPEPEPIPSPEPESVHEHEQTQEPPPSSEPAKTTIIDDILGAVGLDDDRLLIIGLLFILINSKADTTVILALIYLLL